MTDVTTDTALSPETRTPVERAAPSRRFVVDALEVVI